MMSDEDRQLMDRAAHDAGPLVGVELVAFRQGFAAALSRRDKRIAELEAVVARLPIYADTGKSFVPGVDEAWTIVDRSVDLLDPVCVKVEVYRGQRCYSTHKAAEAARRK